MSDKTCQIYKITNLTNNKIYIGYAKNPEAIFANFKSSVRKCKIIQPIHQAMLQDGIDNFKLEIIDFFPDDSNIEAQKNKIIKQYRADDIVFGYNFMKRGTKLGHKNKPRNVKISNIPWNKGMKMSEEFKQKCRDATTPPLPRLSGADHPLTGRKQYLVEGKVKLSSEVSRDYIDFPEKKLYSVVRTCFRDCHYDDGDLTLKDFYLLASQPCHWCGKPPSQIRNHKNQNYSWTKNGLDRKDNSLPHLKSNVVPACWCCNDIKGSMSYAQFEKWIDKIYNKHYAEEK